MPRALSCVAAVVLWGCAGSRPLSDGERPTLSNPWGRPATVERGRVPPADSAASRPVPPAQALAADSPSDEPGMDDEGASAPSAPSYPECVAPLDLTEPMYVLPFAVGDGFPVQQGTCGPVTHRGAFAYAYDFEMPRGTGVLAARGGVGASVVEFHPENTNRSADANYVVIRHDDGQHSRYLHLRTDGVVIAEGDTVLAGDLIAYSGNSGRSSRPHLHFDVTRGCGRVSTRCPTLPVTFMNADDKALRGGRTYEALAY